VSVTLPCSLPGPHAAEQAGQNGSTGITATAFGEENKQAVGNTLSIDCSLLGATRNRSQHTPEQRSPGSEGLFLSLAYLPSRDRNSVSAAFPAFVPGVHHVTSGTLRSTSRLHIPNLTSGHSKPCQKCATYPAINASQSSTFVANPLGGVQSASCGSTSGNSVKYRLS
jgi:hypothetical protein